jgi:hypothetical protein
MFHLLTDTSLFLALPNDCYCQLSGEPLMNMKLLVPNVQQPLIPSRPAMHQNNPKRHEITLKDERSAKRMKVRHEASSTGSKLDLGGTYKTIVVDSERYESRNVQDARM